MGRGQNSRSGNSVSNATFPRNRLVVEKDIAHGEGDSVIKDFLIKDPAQLEVNIRFRGWRGAVMARDPLCPPRFYVEYKGVRLSGEPHPVRGSIFPQDIICSENDSGIQVENCNTDIERILNTESLKEIVAGRSPGDFREEFSLGDSERPFSVGSDQGDLYFGFVSSDKERRVHIAEMALVLEGIRDSLKNFRLYTEKPVGTAAQLLRSQSA